MSNIGGRDPCNPCGVDAYAVSKAAPGSGQVNIEAAVPILLYAPHVDGVLSVEVDLLESGRYSRERVEVFGVGGTQHLGDVPRVHEHRLAARHALIEPHAVQQLDTCGPIYKIFYDSLTIILR